MIDIVPPPETFIFYLFSNVHINNCRRLENNFRRHFCPRTLRKKLELTAEHLPTAGHTITEIKGPPLHLSLPVSPLVNILDITFVINSELSSPKEGVTGSSSR
ncbi:hypothetical protein Fcan01_12909 [Folsomia candida]|uniref:Uncharacterized protein n=1 Tax=Folsomia candida TaxID=158441 RepID=A0A226E286_FOLCA|nr:hypothetical protein Fcan01_12909 [Folsomia candida]